jgi:hypothetical protein
MKSAIPNWFPRNSNTEVQMEKVISLDLEDELLEALDKFVVKQGRPLTREQAVRMILVDALISYGIAPLDAPPPVNPRDAH